ncbi:MAG: leucine--tRNA ligase, partial [Deltaproteobacteria bacterium]
MKGAGYSPWKMTEKWQERWEQEKVFVACPDPSKPKFYCYEFPPFPSGSLHMGHVRNYVIGDATARFKRLMGWNVLYAQGFDSLGLPVEEAALKAGETPKRWVEHCISKMAKELVRLGLSYDHTRFISYHDPEYYRWTQWIFLKLYEAGMVYRSEMWVGWCEKCRTAVAAELIEDGLCWRCGSAACGKKLFQWFIDVKQIAPELLDGLNKVVFQKSANAIQRNWIGRKEGYYVTIPVEESSVELEAFTTTIELLYGVTFLAVAPENPCLLDIVKAAPNESNLLRSVRRMCATPRIERLKASQQKGIFTGRFGINPLNGNRIPIFVASFVVGEFGAGVVLGCPAHDKKDFNFAKAMNLPIIRVVDSHDSGFESTDEPYVGEGVMINSACYDGKETAEAAKAIASDLIKKGCARKGVSFSVKNWCISRQRYWSVPIPIIFCQRCGMVPVRESDLPVELPTEGVDLKSLGNPLEHHAGFVNCDCPNCGRKARRETSTLDTFVNSSWAYLRYCNTDH